ncbi:shikimate kinase [Algicella marina]|uniref:Shikimate kinase n=1 Tax=Algicella marina TaxID=2683284 RepID=A0A6P1T3U8_9RHOB|nr:shikimate kinase [Algicella marina]QHQ35192.1 shikimate kinase [Algicella marina]
MPIAGDPKTTSRLALQLTRPLVLVGLMGAGKTSVGRRLAEFLGVAFCDSDAEIEAASGMEVREIFERFGEPYFRAGERRVIARLLEGKPGVVATGGGAFLSPEIRQNVAEKGVSVWLDADLDTLWARVKDKPSRPLLQRPDAKAELARLKEGRAPVYAQADIRVMSEADGTHDAMVRRILEAVVAHDRARPEETATLRRIARDA